MPDQPVTADPWTCDIHPLDDGTTHRYLPRRDGATVPRRQVLQLWQTDPAFRSFFISLLAKSAFSAYRWETPPLSASTADSPFEFVLLDAPRLERKPDPHAFATQFRAAAEQQQVLAFPNLGNDAVMVVPRPIGPRTSYVHLATFIRHAPDPQAHALWQVVGQTVSQRLSNNPLWLSTAGMGVAWLHVRLDSQPKYYGFTPYRDPIKNRRSPPLTPYTPVASKKTWHRLPADERAPLVSNRPSPCVPMRAHPPAVACGSRTVPVAWCRARKRTPAPSTQKAPPNAHTPSKKNLRHLRNLWTNSSSLGSISASK